MKTKQNRKQRRKPRPRELSASDFARAGFVPVVMLAYDEEGRTVYVYTWTHPRGDDVGEEQLAGSHEWLRQRLAGFNFNRTERFGDGLKRKRMDRAALLRRRQRHESYSGY